MTLAFGWKPEFECLHDVSRITSSARVSVSAADVPDNVDLANWIQDDQLQLPFCHAHMRTGCEEILQQLVTGDVIQYSRYYAAITDMRQDGDDRYPEGASIKGSMLAAIKTGAALETLMPYLQNERQYSNKIKDVVTANALNHHIKSMTDAIRSYDEMLALLITGRYVIAFGLDWTTDLANLKNVTKCDHTTSGGILGGHAVLSFGWTTVNGSKWPYLHNSHLGWGVRRRVAMCPQWWDRILSRSRFGAFGISDIALDDYTPKPRDLSFSERPIKL